MKKKILGIIFVLISTFISCRVFALEKSNTSIKKVVSIVYDDSGSMNNGNEDWAYASYSLQNLIGLMNLNDELSVVKMSNPYQIVNFDLTNNEGRSTDIKLIFNWGATGGTPFASVDTAVSWLKTKKSEYKDSQNVEYWLIVITDGSFGSGYPSNIKGYLDNINNAMGNSKYEGVLVAIGNEVPSSVKNDWKKVTNNHLITASNSSDIVNAMSEVSGLILGQGGQSANVVPTISTDGNSITFETNLPLQKFIIFEQNQSVSINSILGNEVKGNVVADFETNKPGYGNVHSRIVHCESADGNYLPAGKITVNFDSKIDLNDNKFKILMIPAVNVSLMIVDKTGNIVNDLNNMSFKEGETVEFAAEVISSIDNSVIDLRNWANALISELVVNEQSIKLEYNRQDNKFYGKYKIEAGSNLTYVIVTLPGYFRAKSDVLNIYPREKIDNVSLYVSGNKIDVSYKYVSEYEEIAVFEYIVTGGKINGICDFEFKNMPKGITVSVNGIFADKNGRLSLKIYNDVPAEVKFYRNKDYKEVESSKILIDVTSEQYQLEWTSDSITEVILNPVKRNIVVSEFRLDAADTLSLNNFNGKDIYIFSVLGDGEYLSKEELQTLKLEYAKIKGISLESEVIEYNGRYALRVFCKKELMKLFVQTGEISSSLVVRTIYNEKSNNVNVLFMIKDSFTKYILPILLLLMIIILIGYLPGIKKRINKHYCIQVNGEYEMIRVKSMTKILPYITEVGFSSELKLLATGNSNRVKVINNFMGQSVYVDNELILENQKQFDMGIDNKLKIIDGTREIIYIYCDSRGNDLMSDSFDDISDISLNYDDDYFTSSDYNEDYY